MLLAAGRLHHNKGFDVLRALARLPDATLWLAGTGPEQSALHALATGLGVAGRVRFLGWRDDVTTLMASVDVFVCPSRHEGLGSIVLEAWAHGCPIVATASQGPAELIRADQTGLLTPWTARKPWPAPCVNCSPTTSGAGAWRTPPDGITRPATAAGWC